MQAPHTQQGAAMVEFIVGAVFVLVPMTLALQALGKFADVQATANTAARYAAWEKTVWSEDTGSLFASHNQPNQKSSAQIRNEIMVRVINDRRTDLKYASTDRNASTYANGIDPLWHDADDLAFVDDPQKLKLATAHRKPANDLMGTILGLFGSIPIPQFVGTLVPPVPVDTLDTGTLTLQQVAAGSGVYQRLWSKAEGLPDDWAGLDFDGRSGILSNTWAANASSGTKAMVAESVPTAGSLGQFLDLGINATILVWDPTLTGRLDLGRIAPDVVPDDRIR